MSAPAQKSGGALCQIISRLVWLKMKGRARRTILSAAAHLFAASAIFFI